MVISMSLFTALRGYFTIRVLRNLIGEKYKKIPSTFIFVLSFLTIIAMPLPWTIELWDISIYRGSLLNNQFHNPTQTANSAFAMGTLLALINTNKQTNKLEPNWIWLYIFYTLAFFSKPSFLTIATPAFVILSLIQINERNIDWKKYLGISIYSALLLIMAISWNFGDDSEGEIIYKPFLLMMNNDRISTHLYLYSLTLLFAPLVLLSNTIWKENKQRLLSIFIFICVLAAFLQFSLFVESGPRLYHGNLGWSAKAAWAIMIPVIVGFGYRHNGWRKYLTIIFIWLTGASGLIHIYNLIIGSYTL